MTRVLSLVCFILFFLGKTQGQCPTLNLSSTSGSTCGTTAVTVSGNTFGGSANKVTITENGAGTVSPASSSDSPFSFTYTPRNADFGKTITITVLTNDPKGTTCNAARSTYTLTVYAVPSAPVVGTITTPTCSVSTGSVVLSDLPTSGTWTLTRNPGDITTSGTGSSVTISSLSPGTYTYTVENSSGCISPSSQSVVIPSQPEPPDAPSQTTDCSLGAGRAVVTVTAPLGTGLTYSIDGGTYQSSATFSNITDGIHVLSVRNSGGCTTAGSAFQVSCTCSAPPAVIVGAITQPTCNLATGSVALSGLPSTGTWTLTRSPGNVSLTGSGTSTIIAGLPTGTYTFIVSNSGGCPSSPSASVVISGQTVAPNPPVIGTITPPTCAVPTGSVQITGLPATGVWTLTRFPGAVASTGSGTMITLTGLPPGQYNYTVTNGGGCISGLSANVVLPAVSSAPSTPAVGAIIQPGSGITTGSVVLSGLPLTGLWTLTRSPDNVILQGTGSTVTVSGLSPGIYNFSVTNSDQCTSGLSDVVTIGAPAVKPVVAITFPAPVCFPATIDLTDPKITTGSTPNLIFTYWSDASATIPFTTPRASPSGTWYIKGTSSNGTFAIEPVMVTVFHNPIANAGPDQVLINKTSAQLDAALINNYETGLWSVVSGSGEFFDPAYPKTSVSGLSENKNTFSWKVTNGVCPASIDTIVITLHGHLIPTLITPNMDGKNDYLIIKGFDASDKLELVVFDRRGVQVYKSENYDNLWNGVDMNGQPLEADTYFYILKTDKNVSLSGYVLIRK